MKKIGLVLVVAFLVLAAGSAFGDEYAMTAKGWASDPDSLINILDPSNAPAPVLPTHAGLMGLTEEGLPGARGSAAGGVGEVRDSLVNDLDPSYEPARSIPKKTTTGDVMRFDADSYIHQLSPIE